MGELALRVSNMSKVYHIGPSDPYLRFRRSAIRAVRRAKRAILHQPPPMELADTNLLWALRDVSFDVKHGEAVGIIGRNGAGKSTLLKILSRVTRPTSGHADVYGRLGSLLEVGTGFHPELTGRENIYLNAAILGMKKDEIAKRFDEIVAFAELEKFVDTPIKHYSTGMYARLAFSVSAHLDPEILVLDEVLAVGDAAFQKKCLGKMEKATKQGRTIMFVSHDVSAVLSWCTRCILLDQGCLVQDGSPSEVTSIYLDSLYSRASDPTHLAHADRYGNGKARFTSIDVTPISPQGRPQLVLTVGSDLQVDIRVAAVRRIVEANVAVTLYDATGYRVIDANTALKNEFLSLEGGQEATIRFVLHNVLLKPDVYRVGLWLGRRNVEDIDGVPNAKSLTVAVNPNRTLHFQVFPGVYQCEFTETMNILDQATAEGISIAEPVLE